MKHFVTLLACLCLSLHPAAQSAESKTSPNAAPVLTRVAPRGFHRSQSAALTLSGTNLASVTNLLFSSPKLTGEITSSQTNGDLLLRVTAAADLPRGAYDLSVRGPGGVSGKLKLHLDDLANRYESATNGVDPAALPVSFWGALDSPADRDEFTFAARAGQTLVLELAVKTLGSKIASPSLTLLDAQGVVLDTDTAYDGSDRFLAFRVHADGRYTARVADAMLGSSAEHFYRLSVGELPFVTAVFPLSLGTNATAEVALSGFNLPSPATARVTTGSPGEVDVPLDPEKFRSLRSFKILAEASSPLVEAEPNDTFAQATPLPFPASMNGRIGRVGDADLFRCAARAGEEWIIETDAARRGSPIDTKIEVLHPDGRTVARLLLQAVRNSAITFRGIDSVTADCRVENWEEMELNEHLYLSGEVVKLFRAPQGPDSGFVFYTSGGKRRAWFDTSAAAHALDEPCFTVVPHPLGTKLAPNGLPVFSLAYQNDDDGERRLGSDSRLRFTAPTNGAYLVRVTDTRGHGGDRFGYRLVVRPPRPDFTVSVSGANATVPAGSGQSFTVTADRVDGFESDITVALTNLPPGFTATTPLVIQAGHSEAKGTLHAPHEAPKDFPTNAAPIQLRATATVTGKPVTKDAGAIGVPKIGAKPKLRVFLEPEHSSPALPKSLAPQKRKRAGLETAAPKTAAPPGLTIAPGQRVPALLRIERNGHDELVTFFVDNLPHGVIVDDIGLNGVLIPKGETERRIFLNCAKWVPEQDRWCYGIEQQAGKQTSAPLLLRVRRAQSLISTR